MTTTALRKGTAVTVTLQTGEVVEAVTEANWTPIQPRVLVRIPGRFMPVGIPVARVRPA